MKLGKRPKRGRHASARENKAIVERFRKHCSRKGWSMEGAMRELIHDYLRYPFPLHERRRDLRVDALLGSVDDGGDKIEALKKHALKAGIPVSEAIRQIVRSYMESAGA